MPWWWNYGCMLIQSNTINTLGTRQETQKLIMLISSTLPPWPSFFAHAVHAIADLCTAGPGPRHNATSTFCLLLHHIQWTENQAGCLHNGDSHFPSKDSPWLTTHDPQQFSGQQYTLILNNFLNIGQGKHPHLLLIFLRNGDTEMTSVCRIAFREPEGYCYSGK